MASGDIAATANSYPSRVGIAPVNFSISATFSRRSTDMTDQSYREILFADSGPNTMPVHFGVADKRVLDHQRVFHIHSQLTGLRPAILPQFGQFGGSIKPIRPKWRCSGNKKSAMPVFPPNGERRHRLSGYFSLPGIHLLFM